MDNLNFNSSGNNNYWALSASSTPLSDDILVPAEFLDTLRRKTYDEPERKLMLAVLNDAIYCFQHHLGARARARKKLFVAAEQWIVKNGADWLYSFESICEHLGIDADYLRAGLERYKKRRLLESARAKKAHWPQVKPRLMALA